MNTRQTVDRVYTYEIAQHKQKKNIRQNAENRIIIEIRFFTHSFWLCRGARGETTRLFTHAELNVSAFSRDLFCFVLVLLFPFLLNLSAVCILGSG